MRPRTRARAPVTPATSWAALSAIRRSPRLDRPTTMSRSSVRSTMWLPVPGMSAVSSRYRPTTAVVTEAMIISGPCQRALIAGSETRSSGTIRSGEPTSVAITAAAAAPATSTVTVLTRTAAVDRRGRKVRTAVRWAARASGPGRASKTERVSGPVTTAPGPGAAVLTTGHHRPRVHG